MSTIQPKWRGLVARLGSELVVIVLGVLIALWADGWVSERADRRTETERIAALRDNVSATRLHLEEASEEAESAREALTAIAYWQDPGLLGQREDLVLSGLLFAPVFTPEINVYADLKNSGDLALLSNTELRQALARMDAVFEQVALLQADLITVQQLNVDPVVVREFALSTTLGRFLGLDDLPVEGTASGVDMPLLRNLALFKLDIVAQVLAKYDEAGEALDAVERAMGGRSVEVAP